MNSFFRQLLISDAETDGVGTKSVVVYVIGTALLGAMMFALLDIHRLPMIFLIAIFIVTIFLASQGYLAVASWISLFSALGVVALLMVFNLGIRDTIMPGMIVILYAAGLLRGRKGTIIFGIINLGIVASLGILEWKGVIINKFSRDTFAADYLTAAIIIIVAAILQWLTINHLHQSYEQSQEELQKLERTRRLLAQAEDRYRNLVEKIPVVIYISEPGETGQWQYVSPQILTLTGYTPDEWTENPNLWYSRIHPEDRLRVIRDESSALASGSMPQLEYRLLTRAGKYIWIYDESLLTMDSQKHGMVQGFMLDITGRKLAEEQLQQRLNELEAMRGLSETLTAQSNLYNLIEKTGDQIKQTYNASTMIIAIHDPATNLIHFPYDYQNNIRQPDEPLAYGLGFTSKVMEMKKPVLVNSNWDAQYAQYRPINKYNIRAKSSIAIPMMIKNHAIGVISIYNTEIENSFAESDIRLLSTIAANLAVAIENTRLQESLQKELDIQEKLIDELEQKNEELERFSYTASHDLKSPLITIRGFLGYIEQDARAGNYERLSMDLQRISDATEKMHRLLNDLLELSRVGRIMNKAENVPFEQIVQDALERVEGQLKENQVSVKVGSKFPVVYVDRERMVEVVQNLLDNAIKFMKSQQTPEIEIDVKNEDGINIFFVKDNGIGIRAEFQGRVFGLFDKLNSDSEGTGIGLALVKRIIEVHGGKIWIESEEGKGATFLFTLGQTKLQ